MVQGCKGLGVLGVGIQRFRVFGWGMLNIRDLSLGVPDIKDPCPLGRTPGSPFYLF